MNGAVPDVLVAGGGVIGLSVAEAAARRGLSVTVLERERVGARASWAGAGMLNCRPWPRTGRGGPDYFDLLLASIKLHEQWAARLLDETDIDVGFRRCGAVELYTPERDDAKGVGQIGRLLEGCAARGVRCQRISAAEVAALEPRVAVQDVIAAVHLPDDGQIRTPRFARALTLACRQREVVIKEGVAVADVWLEDGQARGIVAADGSRHGAGSVVMCAGAWTGQFEALRRLAPRTARIEPVRGQIVCYQAATPLCSRLVTVGERYIVPRPDGIHLVGSTSEKAGFEAVTTAEAQAMLRSFGETVLPGLKELQPLQGWADLRPGLKGRHPLLGPVPGAKGLFLAAGHYRNGLCLAPLTGETIAALLVREPPPVPIEPWLPK